MILFLAFFLALLCPLSVSANPYSGPVTMVVIDAGHGGSDPGALGATVQEKELTLSISLALARELEDRGVPVTLTRDDDSTLSLQARCDIANGTSFGLSGYPVFISVHINSAENPAAEGFEVFVKPERDVAMIDENSSNELVLKYSSYTNSQLNDYKDIVSRELAGNICEGFEKAFPSVPMRGVKESGLWVLNATWMPSVLVEAGFISNPEEEERMAGSRFQQKLCEVIADAVLDL